jgi:hypothetical protein
VAILSDIYGLETTINLVQQHFEEYDLLQVFQIVHPHLDSYGQPLSTLTGSTDFFSQWSNITRAEVALHRFLILDTALYNKCLETYQKHPPIEHGGPLLFHSMLGHLTVSNDHVAAKHLTYLRNLKLSDFEGENVQTLVSNVRIILKRLAAFERTDPHNPSSVVNRVIPQDFGDTLIQLFSQVQFLDSTKHLLPLIQLSSLVLVALLQHLSKCLTKQKITTTNSSLKVIG